MVTIWPSGDTAIAGLKTGELVGLSLAALMGVQVAPPSEDLVKMIRGAPWKKAWLVINRTPLVRSVVAEHRNEPLRMPGALYWAIGATTCEALKVPPALVEITISYRV